MCSSDLSKSQMRKKVIADLDDEIQKGSWVLQKVTRDDKDLVIWTRLLGNTRQELMVVVHDSMIHAFGTVVIPELLACMNAMHLISGRDSPFMMVQLPSAQAWDRLKSSNTAENSFSLNERQYSRRNLAFYQLFILRVSEYLMATLDDLKDPLGADRFYHPDDKPVGSQWEYWSSMHQLPLIAAYLAKNPRLSEIADIWRRRIESYEAGEYKTNALAVLDIVTKSLSEK